MPPVPNYVGQEPFLVNFGLEHIGLAAKDPVNLRNWYVRVLGASLVFGDEQAPAFLLRLPGGSMIEIYAGELTIPQTSHNKLNGWRHLALRVDSIASAKAELAERGVVLDQPIKPAGGGGSVLFFQDPEGNLLHLVERPVDSALR